MNQMYRLVQRAAGPGNDVYAVGGSVRDALLGRKTMDHDFVTSGSPLKTADNLAALLKAPRVVLDEKHGIYRVISRDTGEYFDFARM